MPDILLIEPHYLPSIEYLVVLSQYEKVRLEVSDHFTKQTFRNRCYILTANGVGKLSIPVNHGNRTSTVNVTIDYRQNWIKDHVRGIQSAYANAPFYDHFAPLIFEIINERWKYLTDLTINLLTKCLELAQIDIMYEKTDEYEKRYKTGFIDLRGQIHPKKTVTGRNFYVPSDYIQLFGNKFVPNLSVLDLLMCEGPNTKQVLIKSRFLENEQK